MRRLGAYGAFCICILVLSGGIFAARGISSNRAETDADRAAILAVMTAQQNDWNQGDIRAFLAGYWNSPELTFAGSKGFTRGWQPVLERYQKTYSDRATMGTLDFSELEVRQLGPDAALVLGRWHLRRQSGDIGGIFTLVFQKFSDGWKIVHDHTTQSPPEPSATK
jgi:ketosteroid isomerase-like protein